MATEVQIANMALSHIGHKADVSAIDGTEQSREAELCAQFYGMARDSVLERHAWNFTLRRVVASPLAVEVEGWDYVYAKPANCLRIIAVLPEGYDDDYSESFALSTPAYDAPMPMHSGRYVPQVFVVESLADGTDVILTDTENATIRYQHAVTDPTKFSATFTMAVSWQLAAHLAGPLIKGEAGIAESRRCMAMAEAMVGAAKELDARQRQVKPAHHPAWIAAR